MSEIILCVTEGEKTEVDILTYLHSTFLEKPLEIICFQTNIYHLYREIMNEDDDFEFVITYKILERISKRQRSGRSDVLAQYSRNKISEIYLFFDCDGHDPLAKKHPNCITDMLKLFNNETENGLLYISYPMVEAFKHNIKQGEVYDVSLGKNYKHHASNNCHDKINKFKDRAPTKLEWSICLLEHIKATNFLIKNDFSYPINYSDIANTFSQESIYSSQLEKFIKPNNHVLVISPLASFLLEYLGRPLFNDWLELVNGG